MNEIDSATTLEGLVVPPQIPNTSSAGALFDVVNESTLAIEKLRDAVTRIEKIIGIPLRDLNTSVKSSLIEAINSALDRGDASSLVGELNSLETSSTQNVVSAINALQSEKLDADLITNYALTILAVEDIAQLRTLLGLGTAALQNSTAFAAAGHTHSFADLTSKPTTVSGFGITNAYTKSEVDALVADAASGGSGALAAVNAAVATKISIDDANAEFLKEALVSNVRVLLSGGGTVTFASAASSTGDLRWTTKFSARGIGRKSTLTTTGFFDVAMPPNGTTVTGVGGAPSRTVGTAGINLSPGETLWYVLPLATNGATANTNFRVSGIDSNYDVPNHWIPIAHFNADISVLQIPNARLRRGESINTANYDAYRAVTADSVGGVAVGDLVPATRQVIAGTGLAGGGQLVGNVTVSLNTTFTDARYVMQSNFASLTAGFVQTSRLVSVGTGLSGGGALSNNVSVSFDVSWGDARYATNAAVTARAATVAEFRSGADAKFIEPDDMWSAAVPVTIPYAATITPNFANFINAKTTMTGDAVLGQPTNVRKGQMGVWEITQDATGSRALTYNTAWWRAPPGFSLSTTPGVTDYVTMYGCDDGKVLLTIIKNAG